jgi:hypothetical protein
MPIYHIPITKASTTIPINTDLITDRAYDQILQLGLKALLNQGMSKIETKDLTGAALRHAQATALEIAEGNRASIYPKAD